jgi:spermidine/putrescine transport system ATP-binding protein
VTALDQVSVDVAAGEFVTLLGPSGCGKTTLLRIIAGFERPTVGRVHIDGVDVTQRPAHRRTVNMVFQRPMLFPHLDVAGNVGFGPRLHGVGRAERARRVGEALALVRLSGYERRRASELSGGQMQRVALARAIVNRPQVLLLDEPLSALDLAIRLEMEEELRRLHRELGSTFVYVTHDQREALALSDRIVVFGGGRVEQVGTPHDIYRRPATPFVARLVGDANLVPCTSDGLTAVIAAAGVPVSSGTAAGPAWAVIHPEQVTIEAADDADVGGTAGIAGRVVDVAYRGTGFTHRVQVDGLDVPWKVEAAGGQAFAIGARVQLGVTGDGVHVLSRDPDDAREGHP